MKLNLNYAKKKYATLVEFVKKMYFEKANTIIRDEVEKYMSKNPDKMSKRDDTYYYEGKIQIRIKDGCADIIDDRGTAFGWLFAIDSNIFRGDIVIINGRPESVKYIHDEEQVSAVYEVIDKLEKAKEKLTADGITQYTYYCDHEEIRVNSFDEIMEKVLNNYEEYINGAK